MLRRLRETAPAGLVPLAWLFAAAAHVGAIEPRTVLIGHLVMDAILAAFAALSWREMVGEPVLRAWLAAIVAGLGITLVGTYALATGGDPTLLRATVFGWMAIPALALAYTGHAVPPDAGATVYIAAGALSAAGALAFLYATLAGAGLTPAAIALVGVGQTAGIVDAAVRF